MPLRRIVADRNLNLHSKSTKGGLVHLSRRISKVVPEDVDEHPLFEELVKTGVITVLGRRKTELPPPVEELDENEEEDEESKVDSDEDEEAEAKAKAEAEAKATGGNTGK